MKDQSRWPKEGWLPLIAGVIWIWSASDAGMGGLLLSLLPGCVLITTGTGALLSHGDWRVAHFTAAGGVLGGLLALPAIWTLGFGTGVLLMALSVACFISAGNASLRSEPEIEGVPAPQRSLGLAAKVAFDEAVLADLRLSVAFPRGDELFRVMDEVGEARELFRSRGWLEKPEQYHGEAPSLAQPRRKPARSRGIDFEHLSFESGYEPRPEEPGRERWLGYRGNRTAHAWVLEHAGEPRPWVVCIHGFRMGIPLIDLSAFDPRFFHEKLGLNMLLPVLPLHGPRKLKRRSGDGFLDGDVLDTVHAEAQAMWDVRRMLSWLRGRGAPGIGVYGLSLGGYNTALLATLDSQLDCAIAGVPASDFSRVYWRHGPQTQLRVLEENGIGREQVAETFRVISPLNGAPKLEKSRLAVFGGVADRIVAADQVRDLSEHWDSPTTVWFQGGHLTFGRDAGVRGCLETTLRETLLAN